MSFPNHIPIDTSFDDDSSSSEYGTGSSQYSTETMSSSIYHYRFQNGRRYHAYKDGKYLFPNDETEQERLDIFHHIYLLMMDNKLHLAPIGSNPQNILDVGTGTGIWAIDMGETFPSAKVIGTDLSPIQPSWVPPNVQFQIDDAELDWTFKKNSFDLVHIRNLGGAIKDWEKLLTEAYKHCKPGGWIDIAEYEMVCFSDDGSVQETMTLWKFYELINEAVGKSGRGFHMAKLLEPVLKKIGFINTHHEIAKGPLGPWAANRKEKEIGAYVLLSAETGFEAFGIGLFTNVLGMEAEEAQKIIQETLKQAKSRKIHAYGKHHFYYGQKPLDDHEC